MQLTSLALAITTAFGSFDIKSIFADGTPGFRINVEEAIRLNQQAMGPELLTNGGFDAGLDGWTVSPANTASIVDGACLLTIPSGSTFVYISRAIATEPGKRYVAQGQYTKGTGTSANIRAGTTAGSGAFGLASLTASGAFYFTFVATTTTTYFSFVGNGNGASDQTQTGDKFSVREIDLSKCVVFQDSAGTLPVTAMEQPLGLILDTKFGVPLLGSQLVTNGGFDTDTAWTKGTGWAIGSGVATKTAGTASTLTPSTAIVPTVGRWYVVEYTITRTDGSLSVSIGAGAGAAKTASGTYREILCASTTDNLTFSADATFAGTVDVVSVREVPGNHFVQPSNTASRPIVSRRVNLLTATATLATQNVTTLAASHVLYFTGTGSVTLSGTATGTYSAGTHTITTTAGTLTVTVSGSVTNADLRLSIDSALPYQRVTSSTDYDEVGFPAYARADGLDDWLESGVVDMSSTNEVTVIAGVTKLSDAQAIILESSSSVGTNGTFALFSSPISSSVLRSWNFVSYGTAVAIANPPGNDIPAPAKRLLTGIGKISTDTAVLRVNGATYASSTSDQGAGNYTAQKFYMGRRAGSSLPFNGRIYGVTVIGKLLDTDTLNKAEQTERSLGRLY